MSITARLAESSKTIELTMADRRLTVQNRDLTSLSCDALICPVNPAMDLRSGIAAVISLNAGRELRAHRPRAPGRPGDIAVVPGGLLKAKYIFLAVVLGETDLKKMQTAVRSAVDRSLRYAEFLRLRSVGFPVLGCPKTLPPYDLLAQEMLLGVGHYFQRRNTRIRTVFFAAYNRDAFEALRREARYISDG